MDCQYITRIDSFSTILRIDLFYIFFRRIFSLKLSRYGDLQSIRASKYRTFKTYFYYYHNVDFKSTSTHTKVLKNQARHLITRPLAKPSKCTKALPFMMKFFQYFNPPHRRFPVFSCL